GRDLTRLDQRRGKYHGPWLSEQCCGDEPRDHQREIQWSTDWRPIPEHARLGKRSGRMAISRQSVDSLATEITFLYTSIAAANCLAVSGGCLSCRFCPSVFTDSNRLRGCGLAGIIAVPLTAVRAVRF